jgi:hypothetical protein
VDGEDAHGVAGIADDAFVRSLLRQRPAQLLKFVDEFGQAGIAAAVHVQRQFHEGVQIGLHRAAHRLRHGGGVAW